ncbi:SDR family oxidoreductase [Janthinobacterium fluminis]|uniref:SDR family oxidoreductase n=1 Tax=Janthinobacterium fluminis TaxID=2987524 RepID=A0ABT5JZI1_9BURK|nr:SDR family oxidoreductase [Janthinobacterium fluminis]MDC8757558.1 SDR family oxidoreductase [Janthinobacterium fluminis]
MFKQSAFTGKNVVVVGGTSGIGRAVALAARAAGATVTVIGRSARGGDGIAAVAADITDPAALARAFGGIGGIDALVLTSGARVGSTRLAELGMDEIQLAFDVKVYGYLSAVKAALPHLAPDASVTLTSGLLSRKFGAGGLLKSMVNAAVEAMAKNLAKELAPRRVNVVSPGVTDTELWGESGAEARVAAMGRIGAGLPVGRVGQAGEVAQAYLLAMANGFMSGAVIDVEGGGLLG